MTTFKGLLDRYKYAFFGGGSQVKIETEISLKLKGFDWPIPTFTDELKTHKSKYRCICITEIHCFQHNSLTGYNTVNNLRKLQLALYSTEEDE